MTKIKMSLKKDEDDLYQASITDDGITMSDKKISGSKIKEVMTKYLEPDGIERVRMAAKLFRSKSLTIKLKD